MNQKKFAILFCTIIFALQTYAHPCQVQLKNYEVGNGHFWINFEQALEKILEEKNYQISGDAQREIEITISTYNDNSWFRWRRAVVELFERKGEEVLTHYRAESRCPTIECSPDRYRRSLLKVFRQMKRQFPLCQQTPTNN